LNDAFLNVVGLIHNFAADNIKVLVCVTHVRKPVFCVHLDSVSDWLGTFTDDTDPNELLLSFLYPIFLKLRALSAIDLQGFEPLYK